MGRDVVGGPQNAFTARYIDAPTPGAPTVVILGWLGASKRALAKYADFYESRGMQSVRSVQPFFRLFLHEARRRVWATWLLDYLKEKGLDTDGHTLIFHIMSNNGAFVFRTLTKIVSEPESPYAYVRDATVGIIFDSCPIYPNANSTKPLAKIIGLGPISNSLLMNYMRLCDWKWPNAPDEYWEDLTAAGWTAPQLFLYSDADVFTETDRIESMIAEKKKRGQDVLSHNFVTAQHVQLLREDPETYAREMDLLLEHVEAHEKVVHAKASAKAKAEAEAQTEAKADTETKPDAETDAKPEAEPVVAEATVAAAQ